MDYDGTGEAVHFEWLTRIGQELEGQRNSAARQWEVLAGISLSLVNIGKVLDSLEKREIQEENTRKADMPVFYDFVQSGAVTTLAGGGAAPLVLDCGGPSVGRIWHVKRLVVGGLTLATAAAGTAEAYATGYISDQAGNTGVQSSLSDLMDATILISSPQTNLPNIGNYADGQFTVMPREKVLVVIRNGTIGQKYVAAGTAKDLRVGPHDVVETEG